MIFAVWIFRPNLQTNYRAGNAKNIFEEFAVYGLPKWSVYAVGATKLTLATMLIAGIWYTSFGAICRYCYGSSNGWSINLSSKDKR